MSRTPAASSGREHGAGQAWSGRDATIERDERGPEHLGAVLQLRRRAGALLSPLFADQTASNDGEAGNSEAPDLSEASISSEFEVEGRDSNPRPSAYEAPQAVFEDPHLAGLL